MKPIFLDTVGLVALWDVADQWHAVATLAFSALLAAHRTMVTTTSVLLECGNAVARRSYRADVCDLRFASENAG
jgi:predicted nucleic acid-binding protein